MKSATKDSDARDMVLRVIRETIAALADAGINPIDPDVVVGRSRYALESGYESMSVRFGFTQFLLELTQQELAHKTLPSAQACPNARAHRKVGAAHLRHADALDSYANQREQSGDAA